LVFIKPRSHYYTMEKINLAEKLSRITDHFNPRIAGELNGQQIKLVKFQGEFVWHHHDNEDELFYVIKGSFDMHLRDKIITINEGEFLIVPRGVEHKPVAKQEVEIILFEPASTINTGNIQNELTRKELQII
jgi:mannose-6-phosphate isomerase-like protein (cupin superfamily)